MGTYVQLMPRMVQRRMEEMENKAAAAEAAASASTGPASQSPVTSPPPPQIPSLIPPLATDVGPEAHGSVLKPGGLDIPVELNAAVTKPTTATEIKLSAATPLTPAAETVNPSVPNTAGNGPSYTTGCVQPPIAGAQTESGSSALVFVPPKPTSLSEDVSVSTVAAPTVSQSAERLSGQERAP